MEEASICLPTSNYKCKEYNKQKRLSHSHTKINIRMNSNKVEYIFFLIIPYN